MGIFTLMVMLVAPSPSAPTSVSESAAVVLEKRCVRCHNPDQKKGELDLTTREALMRGGESGVAATAGSLEESPLYQMVLHEESPAMPLREQKLPASEAEALAAWINAGMPYQRTLRVPEQPVHWAFAPLPHFPDRTTIDGLLSEKLRQRGLSFSPPLAPRARVRRLVFDQHGLAPDGFGEAFVREPTPVRWKSLVEDTLRSPRFGERWAQHWLDVARYADSDGFEGDRDRIHAWPYRDFVIEALNTDLPFDTFVKWQLAGDELAPRDARARAATGFLAAGEYIAPIVTDTAENKARYRADEVDDWVQVVGSGFLGLTVGCARCHDHKFDPISAREYAELAATFSGTVRRELPLDDAVRRFELFVSEQRRIHREKTMASLGIPESDRVILREPRMFNNPTSNHVYGRWGKLLEVKDDTLLSSLDPTMRERWRQLRNEVESSQGVLPRALMVMDESAEPPPSYLYRRGDVRLRAEAVKPGTIAALGGGDLAIYREAAFAVSGKNLASSLGRAALSLWLTDVEKGAGRLLARVAVNRIWQHHFGEPLVGTPNDFGFQSAVPVQRDLLDFLARQLIDHGWRPKHIHRLILLSQAYQQGNRMTPTALAADPENHLWSRRPPRRLEAEAMRDTMLQVSGTLNETLGGPPVKPAIDPAAMATRSSDPYPSDVPDHVPVWRRSIYVFSKRSVRNPFLEAFDKPAPTQSCGRRAETVVPLQGLALMNDRFVRARSAAFADRLVREMGPSVKAQVERAFELAFAREPTTRERQDALRFLEQQNSLRSADAGLPARSALKGYFSHEALVDFCQILFTTNEFSHVD